MAKLKWDRPNYKYEGKAYTRTGNYSASDIIPPKYRNPTYRWNIGKYKNELLKNVPTEYLLWVAETFDSKSPHQMKAYLELQRRYKNST